MNIASARLGVQIPLCHAESVEVIGTTFQDEKLSDSMTGCHVGATRNN